MRLEGGRLPLLGLMRECLPLGRQDIISIELKSYVLLMIITPSHQASTLWSELMWGVCAKSSMVAAQQHVHQEPCYVREKTLHLVFCLATSVTAPFF